jgi:hypothetical protein
MRIAVVDFMVSGENGDAVIGDAMSQRQFNFGPNPTV